MLRFLAEATGNAPLVITHGDDMEETWRDAIATIGLLLKQLV